MTGMSIVRCFMWPIQQHRHSQNNEFFLILLDQQSSGVGLEGETMG